MREIRGKVWRKLKRRILKFGVKCMEGCGWLCEWVRGGEST